MNRSPSPLAETSPLPTALAIALAFAALTFGLTADGADWPTYMRDNARSGVTAEKLRPPLAARWVFTPSHPPRPAWPDPVKEPIRVAYDLAYHVAVANGRVYFGSSAEDKVYCLDAATGAVRWAAFTGGPVRLAPTVWQGNVYVGSDDGHVYCLSGTDGRVLWKFRGAPNDRQAMGNGRMMSVWPVRTGVLVANGVAHFAAGLFPTEGVFVYALDARTGKELWRNDTSGQIYRKMPHPGAEGFSGVSPQGALLASSSVLYVPTGRNVPAAFDLQTGQLIQYRPDRTRVGGTYALVWEDKVFSGPAGLAAYDSRSGDIFAAFPSRQLLLTADMAYLLTDAQITAVQRQNYTELRAKHTALGEKRSAVASDHKRWTRTLQSLQAKQKDPTPETQEAQKRIQALDAQMKELAAEMDKLNQPMAACLKWQCNAAGLCSMVLAGDVLLAGGQDKVVAIDTATGQVAWEGTVKGKAYGLAVADGRLIVSADSGEIACFERPWLFSRATRKVSPPVRAPSVSDLYATAAATIVEQTGITKGYCLVLNSGEGRLAYELAKRTQLRICAFDSDAKRVESARQMLDAAGLYGARVTVQQCSPDRLPCPDYFANLIVCDKAICLGALPLFGKELLRVLRPCGGVLFIGQPAPTLAPERLRKWLDAHGLSQGEIVQANGLWAKFTRGPLPGSADWTHQYGDAGNTACSDDRLVKCPLGVLWFGDPGPAKLVNRHTKPAAPVAAHGRLFIGGDNVLFALDAYNGFPLWERPIPGARRVGTHFESSHLVATADSVYVSAAEGCLRLDAATGETLATFPPAGEARLYGGKPPSAEGQPRKWGYLAVSGDLLLGSTALDYSIRFLDEDSQTALARKQVPKTVISKLLAITPACFKTREDVERKLASLLTPDDMTKWGALLLQELPMGGVASDGVFALDRRTGARRWSHGIPGGYVAHIAVAAGGGRVYLAQTDEAAAASRRVVALEAASGKLLWERVVDVAQCGGPAGLTLICAQDVLLLAGSTGGSRIVALSARDGQPLWDRKDIRYIRHPVVADSAIYAEPEALDLATGETKTREHPLTAERVPWRFSRAYGCGAVSAAPGSLFFRSGTLGFYDLAADEGTSNWGGTRPGCWLHVVPAGGLVLSPESSSGCTCAYPIQTTLALAPMDRKENWSAFCTPGEAKPVKRQAINLGAPGDRRDAQGRLWLSFPRPPFRSAIQVPMRNEFLPGMGYFHRNSELLEVTGADAPWVFTSGACGLTRTTVELASAGQPPASYTVRLCFAELTHNQPGQRVFDVKIQGNVVLKDLDIFHQAAGRGKALVKEFKGVAVSDVLTIELLPKSPAPSADEAPLLCGLEVVRD